MLGKLDQRWVEVVWAGKVEGSGDWIIVERRDLEPYVASQKAAGGGVK